VNKAVWLILKQLLKAALRIEKKLDELLGDTKELMVRNNGSVRFRAPFQVGKTVCPLCQKPVTYYPVQILGLSGVEQILIRSCGCTPQTQEMPIKEGDVP
jgi:hypothetical protein